MTDRIFTIWTPAIVCLIYLITGLYYLSKKNYPWFLIWFSYAVANLGLIWAAIGTYEN